MHAVKTSTCDLLAQTHVVTRGAFAVDRFEEGDGWLYMARPSVGHPHIAYMEAYLLPALGIQVNRWQHHPGSEYAWYDFYVDVMTFETGETYWTSRDLYLDVVVVEGQAAYIDDTDEYLAAIEEGHLDTEEAAYALTTAHTLLNGLAKFDYSLHAWLKNVAGLEATF